MSVLICKNIHTEGPGTIEDYLISKGISHSIVDLSRGEGVHGPESFDTLIMMGGPMSVNEDSLFPYINREEELVRKFVDQNKKVFGVCLGAQIMAKALGSKVYKGVEKEIGWYDILFTGEGLKDPLTKKLATNPETGDSVQKIKVFHWHGETFDIPKGAVKLAGSALFPNQAFRYGERAYAFQFHIEVRKEMIYEWLKDEKMDLEKVKKDTERFYDDYRARAHQFYEAFFGTK